MHCYDLGLLFMLQGMRRCWWMTEGMLALYMSTCSIAAAAAWPEESQVVDGMPFSCLQRH